jgi:hypothetical protein
MTLFVLGFVLVKEKEKYVFLSDLFRLPSQLERLGRI